MKMMGLNRGARAALLALGLAASGAAPASAVILTLDGEWNKFQFKGVDQPWLATFTFTLDQIGYLAITDGYKSGDQFDVYEESYGFVGTTSAPTLDGAQISDEYYRALTDDRWSSMEIELGPGTYYFSGISIRSPYGEGAGAARLSSTRLGGPLVTLNGGGGDDDVADGQQPAPVPLPASGLGLLAGLAALTGLRRRQRG